MVTSASSTISPSLLYLLPLPTFSTIVDHPRHSHLTTSSSTLVCLYTKPSGTTTIHQPSTNMAIISPSIKAQVNRKQLKCSYRIPRSLKKAIEKNVKKIIKKHEHKLREVEVRSHYRYLAIDIEARTFQARGYLDAFDHVIQTFDMTDDLAMVLDALLTRCNRNTESAIGRQKAGLLGKKAFAKKVLEGGYVTEEIKQEMMAWKGQDKDAEEESGSESDE
ncbi:hypothetical protein E4T38_02311 [Aureobasidium subglaciale]|nr:hypothetical protein E4T38_02311 [Aureobasidium subglaciale]KAI5228604.1 hypothetical protein E4T40_02090 [Aureobasidium subglaciale]KAI5231935.1 hypothetical protein E4T41_02310 [Aureobasidium subglaciale]KAI5265825.1 hypothetical protein E4T46_02088 [Aureobasidium subglaciale]